MNPNTFKLVLTLIGLLIFYGYKIKNLQTLSDAGNNDFSIGSFLKKDWFDILFNLGIAVLLGTRGDGISPDADYDIIIAMLAAGFGVPVLATSLLGSFNPLSNVSKKDIVSNIDDKTGPRR